MKKLVLALAVAAAACSPGDSGDTTTTSDRATTTTTSSVPTTTSTPAPTTTTTAAPEAATTTSLAPSTTSADLDGNWADQPLVTTDFGALGWWDGVGWLDAETEGALPVVGGEDYQVIVGNTTNRTTAGPQTIVCDPLQLLGVELADPGLLGAYPGPYGVAVSAAWPLQPHFYEETTDDGTYSGFAADLLSDRGLEVSEPVVKQVVRTDLEGDGVNEVLVVAEDVTPGLLLEPGDYSILFVREVVDGEVQTAVLEETVVLDESGRFFGAHTVGTVADLNDDGRMEVITNSAFFEGFSVSVWEYDDDLGITLRLLTGCGS